MDRTGPEREAQDRRLNDREREILDWAFAGEPVPLALDPAPDPGVYL